jgi:elongation factor G
METRDSIQIIRALVPMAEMLTYQNDLTAKTQGRGSYSMEFDHYDFLPAAQAEKIVAAARAAGAHTHDDEVD